MAYYLNGLINYFCKTGETNHKRNELTSCIDCVCIMDRVPVYGHLYTNYRVCKRERANEWNDSADDLVAIIVSARSRISPIAFLHFVIQGWIESRDDAVGLLGGLASRWWSGIAMCSCLRASLATRQ